jgi:hypothetical protein
MDRRQAASGKRQAASGNSRAEAEREMHNLCGKYKACCSVAHAYRTEGKAAIAMRLLSAFRAVVEGTFDVGSACVFLNAP